MEVRGALRVRHAAQRVEQLGDVGLRIAVRAGVARASTGRARRRAHRRTGRSRRPSAGRPVARAAWRALSSAFSTKVQAVFVDVVDAELATARAGRSRRRRAASLQLGELAGLRWPGPAGVMRRRSSRRASASRCARDQFGDAAFGAAPSSASSSSRRKAWPSAVPCTSMKPPPSFITTFMSVSQSLSSA